MRRTDIINAHLNEERTPLYLIKYTPSPRQERYVRNHNGLHAFIHGIHDKCHSVFCPWRSGQIPLHTTHEQVVISNLYLIKYSPPSLIGGLLDVFHDGVVLEMELQEIHLGIDVEAA